LFAIGVLAGESLLIKEFPVARCRFFSAHIYANSSRRDVCDAHAESKQQKEFNRVERNVDKV